MPDLILQADEVVRMRAEIEAILCAHTGRSVQALRADTDRDRVLTARANRERYDATAGVRRDGQGPVSADQVRPATRRWRRARTRD
ncbi:MAG TPA: ATP-dependent Clp protease proteolytic subunit [Streptosporangiaceae bacterium]|nr:ATP-dependent Clp protease proteolytic subunit [Streptosporangiaceae bacterium]